MFQSQKTGKNNQIGAQGEALAERFLVERGFATISHNYLKKWGEIDLIMQKELTIHFVEVKTMDFANKAAILASYGATYKPEEQLTEQKYQKLARTIETWLQEHEYKGEYQLDLVTVRSVSREKYAKIDWYEAISR